MAVYGQNVHIMPGGNVQWHEYMDFSLFRGCGQRLARSGCRGTENTEVATFPHNYPVGETPLSLARHRNLQSRRSKT